METISINQFSRRYIAGFNKNVDFIIGGVWEHTTNILKVRQPDGSVAEVDVFRLKKADAVALQYKHYLMEQAHIMNMTKPPAPSNVPHFTDPGNIFKHAGCGGGIAYETINLDGDLSDQGVCHKCGAAGRFVESASTPRDTSARFVVPHDANVPLVPATGIVLSDTTFQMLREDVLALLDDATATLKRLNKLEKVFLKNMLMGFRVDEETQGNQYFGIDAAFLYDLCYVMDDGQVITFEVIHASLDVSITYGNSKATVKLRPQVYKWKNTDSKGKVKSQGTTVYNVFVPDFHGEAEAQKTDPLDKWIAKALPRGSREKDLRNEGRVNLLLHYGDFATDAFRFHSDSALARVSHDEGYEPPDIDYPLKAHKNNAKVYARWDADDVKMVINAIKRVKKAKSDGILVAFRKDKMFVSTYDGDIKVDAVLPFKQKDKKETVFRIDADFLLDALSGMKEGATLEASEHMVLVKGGTRSAGISKMKLE